MNLKRFIVLALTSLSLFGAFNVASDNIDVSAKTTYVCKLSSANRAAKEWIAHRESGGSYTARNGSCYGRYQLRIGYLRGNRSAANQNKTADRYVAGRYGSWLKAKRFWQSHHWY